MGHTIGMHHDFDDRMGSQTCKGTQRDPCCYGFMHYGMHKNYWSDCSVSEFQINYRKYNWGQNCFTGNKMRLSMHPIQSIYVFSALDKLFLVTLFHFNFLDPKDPKMNTTKHSAEEKDLNKIGGMYH